MDPVDIDSEQESQSLSADSDEDETLTNGSDTGSASSESNGKESDTDTDEYDLNSTDHFEQIYNNLFESCKHLVNNTQNENIRYAVDCSSRSTLSRSSSSLGDSISLDEIESFFNIDETFPDQAIRSIVLSEENRDQSGPSTDSNKIYVGCIPRHIKADDLKCFFNRIGYSHITEIYGPNFQGNSSKPGFAFVTFSSNGTVEEILYDYARNPAKFQLYRQLRLSKPRPRVHKTKMTTNEQQPFDSNIFTFPLDALMYGTLVGSKTMQNIVDQQLQDEQTTISKYGCIIHQFLNKSLTPSCLKINTKERKFWIDISVKESILERYFLNRLYRFEWNFRDLKGNKFTPVILHGLPSSNSISRNEPIDPFVYFLCEIRRPPCISYVTTSLDDTPDTEIRLPGLTLMGRANAWIFQIRSEPSLYKQFGDLLHKYRLCVRPYQASNIVHLLKTNDRNFERLVHIDVVSMKKWNDEHRDAVFQFRSYRWLLYPFETKFEIMKLISKHIITINEWILDERLDFILSKITLQTLMACIDKILEFAHLWQPTSEKSNDEDWDDEQEDSNEVEDHEPVINTYELSKPLKSAIGKPIDSVSPTTVKVKIGRMNLQDLHSSDADHSGSLSRLLCFALDELNRKYQLNQTKTGVYITKQEMRQRKSNELSIIRKVFITPTTRHYEGPHPEELCTVTRRFVEVQDYFLRVSFRDEDYCKLKNGNKSMGNIYKHIRSLLDHGLNICGRKYEFLAFSSSQLREHSCWMFSEQNTNGITCTSIRKWMGKFEHIHPVAKMAARLGQSFSTTKKGKELSKGTYIEIDDIRSPIHPKALYTDGIGIIASRFAKELSEQMNLTVIPSAFQIRCGGYKGMVCVDVANKLANHPKLNVVFRKSMNKFASDNYSIDIVRTSDFSLSYLNRQMILLLSNRGISDDVFHQFQNEMINEVTSITNSPERADKILWKFNGKSGGNGTHRMMIDYFRCFGLNTERFIQQILQSFQAFQLKQLRTKARILIENGCVLLGVVDETRTLKYGQVFIQIESNETDQPRIIQGPVIVTRNPSLHPGDIRRYEAVDNPLLHILKNVIVFPMDGPKSMTAELAGGDLDGDTFWISWDQRLLFNVNYPALCYESQPAATDDTITNQPEPTYGIPDICRFFVEYLEADNLGVIATWHMALADSYGVRGAEQEKCLALARMHSIAVDFVKTGERPPPLTKAYRPLSYPNFMEKKDKPDYESTSVLGQLYKVAKKVETNFDLIKNPNNKSFPYSSLLVDGYLTYVDATQMLIGEYDRELRGAMRHYGVHRESEIISGYMTKFMAKQYAKVGKVYELRNEIAHVIRTIRHKYIQLFWREFYLPPSSSSATDEEQNENDRIWHEVARKLTWHNQLDLADFYDKHTIKVEQKASAWFYATYHESKKRKNNSVMNKRDKFYSFAWLVYPILFRIYDHHQNETPTDTDHDNRQRKRRRRHRRKKNRKH